MVKTHDRREDLDGDNYENFWITWNKKIFHDLLSNYKFKDFYSLSLFFSYIPFFKKTNIEVFVFSRIFIFLAIQIHHHDSI